MAKEITSTEALQQASISVANTSQQGIKAPEQTTQPFVINNIVMRSVDRTPKEVGRWRSDHQAAESIYYPSRSRLYDTYSDTELDGHLSGLVMKRLETVLNKNIRFVKDSQEIDKICLLIKTQQFRAMLKEILSILFWGCSGFEFIPGDKFAYKTIPRKNIKTEKKVIAINQTDNDGIPYEKISNIWVVGEDRDLGLYLKCAFYVLLKKGSFSDWANYIEIFGQPLMVTKYDTWDEKTKSQLTRMMDEAGASLRISMPKQADFEIMDGKTSNGNGDLQRQFVNACNEELSVLVLGNTETTKSSSSSGFAQSNTHSQQQSEISKSDLHLLLSLINSDKFIAILASYGYDVEGGVFVADEEVDVNELLLQAQIDEALEGMKVPLSDDYFYQKYNRPKPDNYDELKEKLQLQQQQPPIPIAPETGEDPIPPIAPSTGNKPVKPKQPVGKMANLSAWYMFRNAAADFFAPAHKKY